MAKAFQGQYEGERVLFVGREHGIHILLHLIPHILIGILVVGVFIFVGSLFSGMTGGMLGAFISILAFGLFIFRTFLCYKNTIMYITSRRILKNIRAGFFTFFHKELQFDNIKHTTSTKRNILESFFHYGNIKIQGYDEKELIYFDGIACADELALYISRIIDYRKKHGPTDELSHFMPRSERKKDPEEIPQDTQTNE